MPYQLLYFVSEKLDIKGEGALLLHSFLVEEFLLLIPSR